MLLGPWSEGPGPIAHLPGDDYVKSFLATPAGSLENRAPSAIFLEKFPDTQPFAPCSGITAVIVARTRRKRVQHDFPSALRTGGPSTPVPARWLRSG